MPACDKGQFPATKALRDLLEAGTSGPACSAPKPIYLTETEATKPLDEIIDIVRSDLARVRGKLFDAARLFPGWRERVEFAEGGITCVISALHHSAEEYRGFRAIRPEATEPNKGVTGDAGGGVR